MPADRSQIAELRHRLAKMEGRLPSSVQPVSAPASAKLMQGPAPFEGELTARLETQRLKFGIAKLDGLFTAPGLLCASLHEFYAPEMRLSGALSGFVCALLALLMQQRDGLILWALDPMVQREAGVPHASGLVQYGVDPARLLLVRPRQVEDVLWAMEEGGSCSSLCAVVGEIAGSFKAFDLTVTRRLVLRAEQTQIPVFLMRHGAQADPSAALSRWRIEPRLSGWRSSYWGPHLKEFAAPSRHLLGLPSWQVKLEKNRDGRPGFCDLEWNYAKRCFNEAPAHSVPVVRRAGNGSYLPTGSGQVVALRPHG